jgi:hypothetical protein
LAVGVDDFHGGLDVGADDDGVGLVAEIDDNLLNAVERRRFAEVVGVCDDSIAGGRSNDEGIALVGISMQFHRRPIEDNG